MGLRPDGTVVPGAAPKGAGTVAALGTVPVTAAPDSHPLPVANREVRTSFAASPGLAVATVIAASSESSHLTQKLQYSSRTRKHKGQPVKTGWPRVDAAKRPT